MSSDNSRESDVRALIGALIRLNGLSISKAADQAGLNRSNTAGWLRGRTGALSTSSQAKLAESLGLIGGRLRTDRTHEWLVESRLDDIKSVLESTQSKAELSQITIAPVPVEEKRGGGAVLALKGDKGNQTLVITVQPKHRGLSIPDINPESLGFGCLSMTANIENRVTTDFDVALREPRQFNMEHHEHSIQSKRGLEKSSESQLQAEKWSSLLHRAQKKGLDFDLLEKEVQQIINELELTLPQTMKNRMRLR